MESRKNELLEELNKIRAKEIEDQLKQVEELDASAQSKFKIEKARHELHHEKKKLNTHNNVTLGDFVIKFLMAFAISGAFMYIVYTGTMHSPTEEFTMQSEQSGLFELLSVVGPLFGMVLSYYFGNTKSSANGE